MTLADKSQTAFNTRAERSEHKGRGGGGSLKVKPETSRGEGRQSTKTNNGGTLRRGVGDIRRRRAHLISDTFLKCILQEEEEEDEEVWRGGGVVR